MNSQKKKKEKMVYSYWFLGSCFDFNFILPVIWSLSELKYITQKTQYYGYYFYWTIGQSLPTINLEG